ncbi:hypothetical protein L6452_20866 [Arctium lappa]|uniref:Uncharacterized protein n=1 Tax=Arctium lappa TaxID=4217 RepID=A0ACB9BCM1_ARCLA|nr:hypothetical protein L6452_20866 [Arctium lappa]
MGSTPRRVNDGDDFDSYVGSAWSFSLQSSSNVPINLRGRALLSQCRGDDDLCKKVWCHNEDAYCDQGACVCHARSPTPSQIA